MASARPLQLNIRSDFVRQRTDELVRLTGMTATRIIEEALAHYVPPTPVREARRGLVERNGLLVLTGGPRLTVEQVEALIDETRNGVRD